MICYHGTPISGSESVFLKALLGGHAFISYAAPAQLHLVVKFCSSFAVDNGAYSFWRSGKKTDWAGYHEWVKEISRYQGFDWAVMPDVIGGTEEENDKLIEQWPLGNIGVPVWHMHESIERLSRLCKTFSRVAIGGSCEYSNVGGKEWWDRMDTAYQVVCVDGIPMCKIHMLRGLRKEIVTGFPLSSADSTTLGRNVSLDKNWRGGNAPNTKEARAVVLRERLEMNCSNNPVRYVPTLFSAVQDSLF
jgi:hypothetical protein